MTITLYPPLSFTRQGQRSQNEDTIYPAVGYTAETPNLFIVCDGMGGADKGEIASQVVCKAVVDYVRQANNPVLDDWHMKRAMQQANQRLYEYLQKHPLLNRMGTTVALLQFHTKGATVAHMGDSRVIQVRNGTIIFQTADHKQVNELVEAGVITPEQAQTHPWRNRLSRAAIADSSRLPETNRTEYLPDVVLITDILPDDYFMVFSDGLLEQVNNHSLEFILNMPITDSTKLSMLLQLCEEKTKDNYSGFMLRVHIVHA